MLTVFTWIKKPSKYIGSTPKICTRCEFYLFYEGVFCPCCNEMLKTSAADKKSNENRIAKCDKR
jgi:uncharacterized Zn finger protein (UPF0148 family)